MTLWYHVCGTHATAPLRLVPMYDIYRTLDCRVPRALLILLALRGSAGPTQLRYAGIAGLLADLDQPYLTQGRWQPRMTHAPIPPIPRLYQVS